MKKFLIALLVLIMCFSFFACGSEGSGSNEESEATEEPILSLQELVSEPEFQQIFADEEDDVFTYAVSASDDSTFVYEVTAKKTYDDPEFFENLSTEEIMDKFSLDDLQKLLKRYGFGDVTIVCRIINGDGTVMTERTLE